MGHPALKFDEGLQRHRRELFRLCSTCRHYLQQHRKGPAADLHRQASSITFDSQKIRCIGYQATRMALSLLSCRPASWQLASLAGESKENMCRRCSSLKTK